MIIKFLGFKVSLEIIILMLVIVLIIMVHSVGSCCNAEVIGEGFANTSKGRPNIFLNRNNELQIKKAVEEQVRKQLAKENEKKKRNSKIVEGIII